MVHVGGSVAMSPARQVAPEEAVHVLGSPRRFASRGGEKLDGALDEFDISVRDLVVLDAGASTGGFTDCLLQRGAQRVYAVDVGYGQLDHRLRVDPRVVVRERLNVRFLRTADLDEPDLPCTGVDLVVADLSFISLTLVAEALASVVRRGGRFLVLVKPQFEVDKSTASAGRGVIRDPAVWAATIARVVDAFSTVGLTARAVTVSSLLGPKGNTEFLLYGDTGLDGGATLTGEEIHAAVLRAARREPSGEELG
jgi:23S rRNA (cytidine1920-2'-O)/16S rRNA (cytidine1409-2'-O)-methyltransferase